MVENSTEHSDKHLVILVLLGLVASLSLNGDVDRDLGKLWRPQPRSPQMVVQYLRISSKCLKKAGLGNISILLERLVILVWDGFLALWES